MNRQDELWKAIIEEFFVDLLELFYPKLIPQIDFSKAFDFMDKDLPKFFPDATEINRKADRIVKVPLLNGGFQWLIIHIEVQGYKDPHFPRRMFTYYYRLADRFDVPIAALVIYSDNNKENRAKKYETSCLNTRLLYEFDTYVIADHSIKEYEAMNNPFAIIFQTALLGIMDNKKDEDLLELKIQLFRNLLKKGYSREKIQRLASFIKYYVRFSKPEFLRKFDERSTAITKNKRNMGIIETVIELEREEAKEKGLEQGLEQGLELEAYIKDFEHKAQSILQALRRGISVEDSANFLNLQVNLVREFSLKIDLEKEKLLQKEMKKIRAKFSPKYSLKLLKTDIVLLLLTVDFSEKSISKLLKCPLGFVKKINKARKK